MDKIIIHSYPARLWYVWDFLVPQLQAQGITNIIIKNDKYRIGNLLSFVLACNDPEDAWHLQDDVVICKDFAKRIKKYSGICCGFCSASFEIGEIITGKTDLQHIWFSFPCIRIPGNIAQSFYNWFMDEEIKSKDFADMIQTGKMDDLIFIEYLKKYYPDEPVTNIAPALVDHIDYLIGGSIANAQRQKIARATFFEDSQIVKDIEGKIINYKVQHRMI